MAETKDQVASEVAEEKTKDDQPASEQSKETEGTITPERQGELIQALQKGYTLTRQELAEIRDNQTALLDSINKKAGIEPTDDNYLTEKRFNELLDAREQKQSQRLEAQNKMALQQIDDTIADLFSDGIITSEKEKDELLQYAVDNKILDLNKAAAKWMKLRESDKAKETAKTKVKQEEGSKVGTSSKTSEGESRGVNYDKVRTGQWW